MLEGMGYYVIRSAGSRGAVDLVAFAPYATRTYFVQCKRQGAISAAEWNGLWELAGRHMASPAIAQMRGERGTAIYRILGPKVKRGDFPVELWTMQ